MALERLPKKALPVEDHWEWQAHGLNVHGWTDENDLLHREGAPAEIWYREDGTIEWEWWWFHGELHREGAPAEIWYRQDGTIWGESWYLHGEEMEPEYPLGCYQDVQAQIGRPVVWALPGNLIPVLLGFLQ